ncbi:hypothetical protein [Xanthomonas campestris]|uniref:hypothetical protein n=1 Tax=Xanthomonas campestris TaxID=339 RepID=UPI0035566A18
MLFDWNHQSKLGIWRELRSEAHLVCRFRLAATSRCVAGSGSGNDPVAGLGFPVVMATYCGNDVRLVIDAARSARTS